MPGVTEGWTLEPDVQGHILAAAPAAPSPRFTVRQVSAGAPPGAGVSRDAGDPVLDEAAVISVLTGSASTLAGKTDEDDTPHTRDSAWSGGHLCWGGGWALHQAWGLARELSDGVGVLTALFRNLPDLQVCRVLDGGPGVGLSTGGKCTACPEPGGLGGARACAFGLRGVTSTGRHLPHPSLGHPGGPACPATVC